MQNLTGKWTSGDGMTYQIVQVGESVFISGAGNGYHNVGFGTIDADSKSLIMQWADTPDSGGFGSKGNCYIDISAPGVMRKQAGSARYGIGNFNKVS